MNLLIITESQHSVKLIVGFYFVSSAAIMSIVKTIVQTGAAVLRKKAKEVQISEIGSNKIKRAIAYMKEALLLEEDGVAIAAPQIGISLRIFVISGRAWGSEKEEETPPDRVFINPVLTKMSRKKEVMDEGCLSVRGKYGKVKRRATATVKAYDENGSIFTYTGHGLLAQIFQHETEHLDGILFTDTATDIHDINISK